MINKNFTATQDFLLRCIRTRAGKHGYGLLEDELADAILLLDAGLISLTDTQPHRRGTYFSITAAGREYLDPQAPPLSEADEFWGAAEMSCCTCGID